MPFSFLVPSLRSFSFLVLASLSALSLAGCGGDDDTAEAPNTPPILDSVEGPSSVTAVNGIYSIPLTIRFHDPDGDAIGKVRYQVPKAMIDKTSESPAPAGAVGVELVIVVAARGAAAKQTYDIVLSAFDSRGGESATVTRPVTLE